jgi:putative phosphoribosyl transferase
MTPFEDRRHAGRMLAATLSDFAGRRDLMVVALPRGGVPVAYEVARALDAPLDVLIVRKVGVPGHEELGIGALASGGIQVLNEPLIARLGVQRADLEEVLVQERAELQRREREYRGDRPALDVTDRTVILVDDGLATGSTMRAAALGLRRQDAAALVIAVPVAPPSTCEEMRSVADQVVCARAPETFYAVGAFYEDFTQTSDDEVRSLLRAAEHERVSGGSAHDEGRA